MDRDRQRAAGLDVASEAGQRHDRWQLDEPASSYLVTLAIGDYTHRSNTATSGLTVDYWIPRGLPGAYDDLKVAAKAVDWIEQRLGPYPFSSLGLVPPTRRARWRPRR